MLTLFRSAQTNGTASAPSAASGYGRRTIRDDCSRLSSSVCVSSLSELRTLRFGSCAQLTPAQRRERTGTPQERQPKVRFVARLGVCGPLLCQSPLSTNRWRRSTDTHSRQPSFDGSVDGSGASGCHDLTDRQTHPARPDCTCARGSRRSMGRRSSHQRRHCSGCRRSRTSASGSRAVRTADAARSLRRRAGDRRSNPGRG